MGFQMSVMCIGQLAMQAAVNRIGTSAIAGYTAANKVDQLSVLVDNAVGIGIANYVAQKLWCRQNGPDQKRRMALLFNADGVNFAMGALLLLGQSFVVPMFVTNPDGGNHAVFQRLSVHGCAVLFLSGGDACLPHRDPERGQYLGTVCSLRD